MSDVERAREHVLHTVLVNHYPAVVVDRHLVEAVAALADWPRPATRADPLRRCLDDHLELARRGDVETDLAHNYHHDVVLLTTFGA